MGSSRQRAVDIPFLAANEVEAVMNQKAKLVGNRNQLRTLTVIVQVPEQFCVQPTIRPSDHQR
jgi:hypothetical protein